MRPKFVSSSRLEFPKRKPGDENRGTGLQISCPQIFPEFPRFPSVSFREANATQKFLKTRIASQRVESRIHPDEWYSIRSVAICSFEPGVCLFFVA